MPVDKPLLSEVFERASAFRPEAGSAYVYAVSVEERSEHYGSWIGETGNRVKLVEISAEDDESFFAETDSKGVEIALRSRSALRNLFQDLTCDVVYLDITGLPHHVWAPLLRSAVAVVEDVRVIYVEPASYRFSSEPTEGQIFDLSEKIRGIAPIPGFATLRGNRQSSLLVALLGFEGPRFSHVLEHTQPASEMIVPVVGVPGYRLEYPFHTYVGNRRPLVDSDALRRVRYITANCPFEAFYLLEELLVRYSGSLIRVAPIGTKPHAVGAVMFKLLRDSVVEIVYDHPIRKEKRTSGSDRLLVYHVSAIVGAGE